MKKSIKMTKDYVTIRFTKRELYCLKTMVDDNKALRKENNELTTRLSRLRDLFIILVILNGAWAVGFFTLAFCFRNIISSLGG